MRKLQSSTNHELNENIAPTTGDTPPLGNPDTPHTTAEDTLLNCPFCGAEARHYRYGTGQTSSPPFTLRYYDVVICSNESCAVRPKAESYGPDVSIRSTHQCPENQTKVRLAWNTRDQHSVPRQ